MKLFALEESSKYYLVNILHCQPSGFPESTSFFNMSGIV